MAPPNKKQFVSLPIDLLDDEVLIRLPVNSLLRFKCVSKSWHDTITSPSFIKFHLDYVTKQQDESSKLLVLFIKEKAAHGFQSTTYGGISITKVTKHTLSTLRLGGLHRPIDDLGLSVHSPSYYTVGSCHGLVCFRSENNILICNPSTRDYKVIPFQPKNRTLPYYVFGQALGANDYKVIVIINKFHDDGRQKNVEVHICSLKKNLWKRASEAKGFEKMCISNGWIRSQRFVQDDATYCLCRRNKGGTITRCDFDDETCTEIKVPDYGYGRPHLETISNRLGLIILQHRRLQIWMLNNNQGEPWMKIVNICRHQEVERPFEYPVAYSNDKILLIHKMRSLSWYDIRTGMYVVEDNRVDLDIDRNAMACIGWWNAMVCIGSLVPLD